MAPSAITDERLSRPSASEFERIMNCDGYLRLRREVENQQVLPDRESAAATAGTELHALNEQGDTTDATYSEEDIVKIVREREEELVRQWCLDLDIPFDQIKIEREVRLWFQDTCSSKLDVLVTFGEFGYYLDTKTGRNRVTPPSRNWQMRVGALCACSDRHLTHVRTAIVNVWGALMPPCDYPNEDLIQIGSMVTRRLIDVEDPGQPTKLGPWCAYCAAVHVCPSQRDQMALAIKQRTINWSLVTPEQKRPLFIAAKMAVAAGGAILDQIKADLAAGVECPGLAKKPDGSARKIKDTLKAYDALNSVFKQVHGLNIRDGMQLEDFISACSISIEGFTTFYRDKIGASKDQANKFLETCDFIEKSPRSGSVLLVDEPKELE